ncbi:MAG: hypothetical protein ABWY27_09720 [Telluria sp.]
MYDITAASAPHTFLLAADLSAPYARALERAQFFVRTVREGAAVRARIAIVIGDKLPGTLARDGDA